MASNIHHARKWDMDWSTVIDRQGKGAILEGRISLDLRFTKEAKRATPTRAQAVEVLHGGADPFQDTRLPEVTSLVLDPAVVGDLASRPLRSITPRPALVDAIVKHTRPLCVVELGVFQGGNSVLIAEALTRNGMGPDSFVMSVDTWLLDLSFMYTSIGDGYLKQAVRVGGGSQMYLQFLANVLRSGQSARVVPIQSTTTNAARALISHGFDVDAVYVDASHDSVDVFIDCENWWPLVRCGGVMWGDDLNLQTVKDAVDAFTSKHGLEYHPAMPGQEHHPGDHRDAWVIVKGGDACNTAS